jgi:glucokinase
MNTQEQIQAPNGTQVGLVVAVDLGGTNLRVATVDASGRFRERLKLSTPNVEAAEDILQAIVVAVRECESRSMDSSGCINAISVVVPGTVHSGTGMVTKAPNVPCLDGFQLRAALTSELQRPVVVENDANAAAVGEMWLSCRGGGSMIFVTLGTGVGGGLILDRKLWRGADGAAGEIGHVIVETSEGAPCTCGSLGCLEVYASATAMVRMTVEKMSCYPQSSLYGRENLTAEMIYQSALRGDELALAVFDRMGRYLGKGLAGLINTLNPETIIIGGGVAAAWDLFIESAREQIAQSAFKIPAQRVQIVPAQQGDDAGLLGAAYLAFEQLDQRERSKRSLLNYLTTPSAQAMRA